MIVRRIAMLVLAAILAPPPSSYPQGDDKNPQLRIEIDVTGKALKKNKEDWIELRSKNFLVVGDADEGDLRMAASELELFRDRFAQLFPRAKQLSSVTTRVVVFRDGSLLRQLSPVSDDKPSGDRGYIRPAKDINYIAVKAGEQLSTDIIREYIRMLSRDSISPVPFWFQTGLEEYFSTYKLQRLGADRIVSLGLDGYKHRPSEKNLIPLATFFTVTRDSLATASADTQELFYAQSCTFFAYLIQTRRVAASLRFINAVTEGQPVQSAFRDTFKLPLQTFEENLRRHIQASRNNGWYTTFVAYTLNKTRAFTQILQGARNAEGELSWNPMVMPANFDTIRVEAEAAPVRVLPESDTEYYRGDLLVHMDRARDAVSYLEHSIELDPKHSGAYASLGLIHAKDGRYDKAWDFLKKAIESDPSNYLAHYYFAWAIREESEGVGSTPQDMQAMKDALRKSIELAPEFVESAEMLAEAHWLTRDDLNSAARLLIDGLKRSPGRETLLLTLAKVVASAGQASSAAWMLQRIASSGAADATMKASARDMLLQLNLPPEQKSIFGEFAVNEFGNASDQSLDVRLAALEKDKKAKARDRTAEKYVRGILTRVDCNKGLTIYLLVGTPPLPQRPPTDERTENLHADTPGNVEWVTDTGQETTTVACGEMSRRVAVTYRPERKGLRMGVPLVVEFLTLPE